MKKTYNQPQSASVTFHSEESVMTAVSQKVSVDQSKQVGADASLSNEKSWGSHSWADDSDE